MKVWILLGLYFACVTLLIFDCDGRNLEKKTNNKNQRDTKVKSHGAIRKLQRNRNVNIKDVLTDCQDKGCSSKTSVQNKPQDEKQETKTIKDVNKTGPTQKKNRRRSKRRKTRNRQWHQRNGSRSGSVKSKGATLHIGKIRIKSGGIRISSQKSGRQHDNKSQHDINLPKVTDDPTHSKKRRNGKKQQQMDSNHKQHNKEHTEESESIEMSTSQKQGQVKIQHGRHKNKKQKEVQRTTVKKSNPDQSDRKKKKRKIKKEMHSKKGTSSNQPKRQNNKKYERKTKNISQQQSRKKNIRPKTKNRKKKDSSSRSTESKHASKMKTPESTKGTQIMSKKLRQHRNHDEISSESRDRLSNGKTPRQGNMKHLPKSKSHTKIHDNMEISKDVYNKYHRRPIFLRPPPGVARLEQALNPSLGRSINKLKASMKRVLQMMQEKVIKMQTDYSNVATDAKNDIMMVRKSLKEIAKQNDKAYDALLEVTSLVRYIHKRAYEYGTQAPAFMSLRNPNIPSLDFRREVMLADRSATSANHVLQNTMYLKSKCMEQEERYKKLKNKYQNRQPRQELLDLIYKSRRTQRKLHGKIRSDIKNRVRIYSTSLNGLGHKYFTAQNMSDIARKEIMNVRDMTQVNIKVRNKLMNSHTYSRNGNMSAALRISSASSSTDENLSQNFLQDYTNRAYRHSRTLQKMVEVEIKKYLIPSMKKANKFTITSGRRRPKHELNAIVRRVLSIISKLEVKMDEIRIYLGNDDVLKERCESLAQESSGLRAGETIIDCDKFGILIGAESGSGDEEEFIPTGKPTQKPTYTKPPSQLSTTEPATDTEGSGEVDGDFEFVEEEKPTEKKEETGGWINWFSDDPNVNTDVNIFKNVLHDKALDARQVTVKLNERAIKASTRLEKMYDKWTKIQSVVNSLDIYVNNATIIKKEWKVTKPLIVETKERIKRIHQKVLQQENEIRNKTKKALKIAERHLQNVKDSQMQRHQNDGSSGFDNDLMSELLASADKIASNKRAIDDLTSINVKPCRVVETAATRLRNNIAELRKKIDQARIITSSIPVTVTLNGNTSIKIPVTPLSNQESAMTSFEMCIKPNRSDMTLLELFNNNSISYQLEMEDNYPKLSLLKDDKSLIRSMTSSYKLDTKSWHQLRISRYGQTIELQTARLNNGTYESRKEVSAFPEILPVQLPPSLAYIGGLPNQGSGRNLQGCVGSVRLDGFNLGLIQQNSGRSALKACTSDCNEQRNLSIIFEGDGYVRFPISILFHGPKYRMENLMLQFRTTQKEGIVFLLNDKLQNLQVLISLSNGSIHMESRTKQGTTILRSTNNTYSDGKFHTIAVTFAANKVDAKADYVIGSFIEETSTQVLTPTIEEGVYLGGWGSRSQVISGKRKLRPLTGCISFPRINNKEIPMFMQQESRNAYLGSCTDNVWLRCVRFTENSKPLILPMIPEVIRLYLTISTDSMGTFLHYKRKNKFDIEFSIDKNEITVSESSGNDETIPIVPHHDQQWITIVIVEENSDVHVKMNSTEVTIPHKGTGWLFTETHSAEYYIAVGGKLGEKETDYRGGVASLIVDDRSYDLRQNVTSHNLDGCEKQRFQLRDHLIDTAIPEKPAC